MENILAITKLLKFLMKVNNLYIFSNFSISVTGHLPFP